MSEQQPAGPPRALRLFALVAVCAGVAALAAAAFIFSYSGIHAVALQAGVNTRLAKGYPLILDVLLVVILSALLALRGAGWPSKTLAWVSLLALLAAAAGADALHAAGDKLPARTAEITVAVLPWALVLIAFVLLLAMLRQAKVRRQAQALPPKWQPQQPPPLPRRGLVPGFPVADEPAEDEPTEAEPAAETPAAELPAAELPTVPVPAVAAPATAAAAVAALVVPAPAAGPNDTLRLVVPRQLTPEIETDGAATEPEMAAIAPDGALDAELAPDDPSSDEADAAPADDQHAADEDPAPAAVTEEPEADPDGADIADPGTTDAQAADPDTVDLKPAEPEPADPEPAEPEAAEPETGGPDAEDSGTAEADTSQTTDTEMPVFHRMWSSPSADGD